MNTSKTNTEVFHKQDKRINELERKYTFQSGLLIFFIILVVVLSGYIVYIEVEEPPFGKWKNINLEKRQTEEYNDYLLSRIDSINRSNDLLLENSSFYPGVFYEVQIGAFQYFDLSAYLESLENLRSYEEDGLQKYVLGKFRELNNAKLFLKDIRQMGISDAFIIAKIDGKRVEVKEAIAAQRKNKKW